MSKPKPTDDTRAGLREEKNIAEWQKYLSILEMLADDRSQPYIARKLGYSHASSIQNILNRFQGLEKLIDRYSSEREAAARQEERERCFDDVGDEDIKVRAWVTKRKAALTPKAKGGASK